MLAYAVVLSGVEGGKVKGSIYELDYARKAEFVIQSALRTDNNRLIYENGPRELPKDYRFEAVPDREYGKFLRYQAVPHDPDALRKLLRDESRKRELLAPGDFRMHIGQLSDSKVYACYGISFFTTTTVNTLRFSKPIRKSSKAILTGFLKNCGYSYIMYLYYCVDLKGAAYERLSFHTGNFL